MELSRSILKEFATVTNGIERPEKSIYLRGTIKSSGDSQYVRIDGSESLTPISEIVDVKEGDRVLVTIENHQATIIGNLTKPPSSYKEDEAIDKAEDALDKAESATDLAESAGIKADEALVDAEKASGIANQAKQDAAEAMSAAENASANSTEAKDLATAAGQNANTAREEAAAAQNAATAAQGEVTRIEGVVTEVKGDIDTALQEVADQAADLQATKETLEVTYAKKTEVSDVKATLTTEISKKVGELQTTVSQTYAAKNDVVEMEGRLQSQITQTAGEVTSVVGKVEQLESDTTEAQKKVDEALEKSAAAQVAANQAQANASASQAAADAAKANAATATQKATEAAQNAATAAATAAEADKKLSAAQTDLNEAKQNLANTINRVDATEAEIAEAQKKVETAQAAVTQAQKDAAEATFAANNAQTAANQAQIDATEAQNAATNAQKKADNAAIAAGNAQAAANKAQQDVAALTKRVTSAETAITQNAEQIRLSATKTEEIGNKLNNLQVGGRNLLRNTMFKTLEYWGGNNFRIISDDRPNTVSPNNNTVASTASKTDLIFLNGISTTPLVKAGKEYTVSFWAKAERNVEIAIESGAITYFANITTEWGYYSGIVTFATDNRTLYFYPRYDTTVTLYINSPKLEEGNKATDWSPAPEDTQAQIDSTNSNLQNNYYSKTQTDAAIKVASDSVTTTVRKEVTTEITNVNNKLDNLSVGSDNLIANGGFPTNTHGWTNTGNVSFYPHKHPYYFGENKTIFCVTSTDTNEGWANTHRFKVKRNTDYTLSFFGFAGPNVRSTDVLFLGRRKGEETEQSTIKVLITNLKMSPSASTFYKATFNTGDSDEGYIRFDHNGSTDGQIAYMFFGEVMLVEGTVAKKYQPSSADTQSQIDSINTNLSNNYYQKTTVDSKLSTTVSGITAQYTQDINTKLGNYYDKSTIDSKLTIDGQGITTYVKNTQSKLDNLKIGSRNLWIINRMTGGIKETLPNNHITGQKECWRINNGGFIQFIIEPEFSKRMYGKTFTFSAWIKYENVVKGTNDWNVFNIFKHALQYKKSSSGTITNIDYLTLGFITGTSDWKKVTYTYTYDRSGFDMLKNGFIFNIEAAKSGTAWVTGIQIEEGTIATDWSPAPEDMATAEQAQNAQNTANTANNKAEALQTQVSSISQKADRIESEVFDSATGLKTKVTQLSNEWSVNALNGAGDILSQLNVNGGSVKIKSALIELDGYTTMTEAFVNKLTANSIVTETIDARSATIANAAITNLNATNIKSGYLDAQRIKSGSITSDKITVTTLSAITANLGKVTSGYIGNGKSYWDLATGNFFNTNETNSAVSIGNGKLIISNKTSFDSSSASNSPWDSLELGTNRIALGNSSGFLEIRPNTIGIGGSSGSATILSSGGLRFGYDFNATVSWFQNTNGVKDWYHSTGYRLQNGRIDLSGGSINTNDGALQLTANTGPVNLQGASVNMRNMSNTAYVTCYAANFSSQSAYSAKTDFENIDNITMLQAILKTDIVKYRFKNNPQKYVGFIINDNGHSPYVIDKLLVNDDNSSFSSNTAIGVAYGAIKELNRKLEKLEAENFLLQAKLEAMT